MDSLTKMNNQIVGISLEDIKCLMKPFSIDVNLGIFCTWPCFELVVERTHLVRCMPENANNSDDYQFARIFSFEGLVKTIFNSTKFLFYSLKDKSIINICNPYYGCRSLEEALIRKDLM